MIVHTDRQVAVAANPFRAIGTDRIREFYRSLQKVIDIAHRAIVPNTSYSITPLSPSNDAEDVIVAMKQAVHYSELHESDPLKKYEERQK